ncbi:MAG: hypothetical protein ACRDMZ_22730 [Solirubrobacteraceae bacterium]
MVCRDFAALPLRLNPVQSGRIGGSLAHAWRALPRANWVRQHRTIDVMPTTHIPSAGDDHDAMTEFFATRSYVAPEPPFELDEHGLPIAEPEPDDPDDE